MNAFAPPAHEETEEQALFRDAVMRFADRVDPEARRALAETEAGYSEDDWRHFAEQGWLAAALPEEDGGLGGGPAELAIIMEGAGRALTAAPLLANAALAAQALARAGSAEQKARWLSPLMEGTLKAGFAYAEPQSRFRVHDCATRAEAAGEGWKLSGRKAAVLGAPSADLLIVSARLSGGRRDASGLALFALDRDAAGLELIPYAAADGHRAADLVLDGVEVGVDRVLGAPGAPGEAGEAIETVVDYAAAMACAEAVGAMTKATELTIAHLQERVQFGQPLIANQALRHRIVELWIAINDSRALTRDAVRALARGETGGRRAAVSAAKSAASRAARRVGQEAVQMHGAMGVTREHAASAYFRRLTVLSKLFGDADFHEARYAQGMFSGN